MVLGDPTTCVYQFKFDKEDSDDTHILKYFIMHGLGLCIKSNSYVAHMFYEWSFGRNTVVPIAMKQIK